MGRLPITLHPRAPGNYPTLITLRSLRDVRVLRLVATVVDETTKKHLEFVVPARQALSQDIPIVNNSDFEWPMTASITGSEYFKGNRALVVPPRSVGLYTVTFKPDWLCEDTADLVLDCPLLKGIGQPSMQFSLKGIGLEPLAEDHVVITCQARDRIEHAFPVKNPCE